MRTSTRAMLGTTLVAALLLPMMEAQSAHAVPAKSAPGRAGSLSADVTDPVIVVLEQQPSAAQIDGRDSATRQRTLVSDQAPLVAELHRSAAREVHTYSLVNAISATVSRGEAARLAAEPAVAEVIADALIKGPDATPAGTSTTTSADPTKGTSTPDPLPVPPGACPAPGKPAFSNEELALIHADSTDPAASTARSLGFTGAGVKVAFLADGVDIHNPDFTRADGRSVFVDYRDFSSDGINAVTQGGEAFEDATSIAAQGDEYNIQHFGADPLAAPCRIRIEGVAPGASLVGLKVFAQNGYSTTSGILQAIDYAVTVDHVNVINESLGYNPFPTTQSQDVLEQFNDAAVAAGTTITVAAGDAGPNDTIGAPDEDPEVINVGASTAYRYYAETGGDGYVPPIATRGWLSDGISGLSSGGFAQTGPTDDVVAPGDLGFAACTPDVEKYLDCANLAYRPSSVEFSGGTSESSPLTAGTVALVIQAYRKTHGGATPPPALIKRIIVSTADDLGHPATLQGSGLPDAYRAVLAAESIRKGRRAAATGNQTLLSTGQLNATGPAGTMQTFPLTVTNDGAGPDRYTLSTRTLGPALDTESRTVTLADHGPRLFNNMLDLTENYREIHFPVAPGRAELVANIAYPGNPDASFTSAVDVVLIDPEGAFAADAIPQGVGDGGQVEVRDPAAGNWTALILSPTSEEQGTVGRVQLRAQTFDFQPLGSVTPSAVEIPAGASRTVEVHETLPTEPGDTAGAVLVSDPAGQTSTAVVTLRSLVDLSTGGHFSGSLVGGNGRQPDLGQTAYYQWDVPHPEAGRTLTVDVTEAGGATDPVLGYLVNDEGQTVSFASNSVTTGLGKGGPVERATSTLQLAATAPRSGRWTLILNFAPALSGRRVATPYSGTVAVGAAPAGGLSLPSSSSTVLPGGKTTSVPVTVKNTSTRPEDYFLDPRLDARASVTLAPHSDVDLTLPMRAADDSPSWVVPADTTSITVSGQSPSPLTFDYGPGIGDPDLGATTAGDTATGSWARSPITDGLWFADPSLLGPYGASPPERIPSALFASVTTEAFDTATTSPTGDLWLRSVDPTAPLAVMTVEPGRTATIPVTITPSAKPGTVVSGTIYVDELAEVAAATANALNYEPAQAFFPAGSQIAALRYRYRVG